MVRDKKVTQVIRNDLSGFNAEITETAVLREGKPYPSRTLITLIYRDQKSSIRAIFKFVNP